MIPGPVAACRPAAASPSPAIHRRAGATKDTDGACPAWSRHRGIPGVQGADRPNNRPRPNPGDW
ncbi:MAG: hypothetical protein AVDCRST_MAG59-651 [uncultured Thermomicrobiales bacterium]|uniref:Uncharacterized protein n=1 Tax=uncultured Thermomicrobiales bacterium TaxID=1645740 RepID=A0A6J4U5G6_9BACT|nr:MAG: hypothetical protein AVDCRST_MAG59-651 [uncultured Thermomicrobiales bacterium]